MLLAAVRAQPPAPAPAPRGVAAIIAVGSAPAPATGQTTSVLQRLVDLTAPAELYGVMDGALARLGSPSVDALADLLTTRTTRTYNGMTIAVSEAADIVRGNEAVRDQVIARLCGGDGRCGGTVPIAAARLVQDVERDTEAQLNSLARLTWSTNAVPPSIVIVTAGLPYRDRPTAAIERAAAALSAAGAPTFVVRVSSAHGFLRDAWDDVLARETDVRAIDLINDRDAQAVTAAAAALAPRGSAPSAAAVEAPAPGAAAAPALPPIAADAEVLARVAAFVDDFEKTFAAVTWREVYTQEDHVALRFSSSGGAFDTLRQRRRLESELLFVWVPADATWIAVRDVVSVDGRPLPPKDRRLPALLAAGPATLPQLRSLAEENGRFNIGAVLRTFNEPTLALLFADDRYRPRFRFSRMSTSEIDGVTVATLGFTEVQRPTVIRDGVRDLPVSGELVVDRATGRVLRTRLQITDERATLRGTIAVAYRFDTTLRTMVPAEMRESYHGPDRERIDCTAVYSDYRRFQTSGRIIIPQ